MEFVANLMSVDVDPVAWAQDREAEGWHVLSTADHLWTASRPYPHLWVTLGAMAAATKHVQLTSAFANNLFRSPVEFAQAALTAQHVSGGRFEAGLGAGWARSEMDRTSRPFPDAADRAGQYIEAVKIVRSLFDEGRSQFAGRYYTIDVDIIGPRVLPPPPLVGALGGPRMIREATPFLDRVELKAAGSATRGGALDMAALGTVPAAHLDELVDSVRAVRGDVPLGLFVLCAVGDDEATKRIAASFPEGSLYGGFFGPVGKVADAILELESHGIGRAQISPFNADAYQSLAVALQARGAMTPPLTRLVIRTPESGGE